MSPQNAVFKAQQTPRVPVYSPLTLRTCLFPVAENQFQPSGLRSGLPGAHLPAHREDRPAAGDQPAAAEADLRPGEGQQDVENQRGAMMVFHSQYNHANVQGGHFCQCSEQLSPA